MNKESKKTNSWRDLQSALQAQDQPALLKIVRDIYNLNQENKDFLHARFLPGEEGLAPYKRIIDESLYPDIYSNKPIRISAGRKAISQYRKATGDETGTLELMVYFVERGNEFTVDVGDIDESFYSSLESMFGRVVETVKKSGPEMLYRYLPRLTAIRDSANGIGWGYYDYLLEALAEAFPDEDRDELATHV